MEVMVGWSGEQPGGVWRKFEIHLDETDLKRIFLEEGLPPALTSEARTTEAFSMLEAEAQRLVMAELVMRVPGAVGEDAKSQIGQFMQQRHDQAAKIKARADSDGS